MSNYSIYLDSITAIAQATSLPIVPMSVAEFDQAEAQLQAGLPHTYTSVIDMDAFEAAFEG